MKVCFINPDFSESLLDPVAQRKFTPTSLAYGAAIFRKRGWDVGFIDDNIFHYGLSEILRRVRDSELIVLSTGGLDRWQCPPMEIKRFYELSAAIRAAYPEKTLVAEGPHTLFNYEKLGKYADYVIFGEPEGVFAEMAKKGVAHIKEIAGIVYLKNGVVRGRREKPPVDVTALPVPLIEILPYRSYSFFIMGTPTVVLETSRGCFFNCSFCFKGMYGKGIRFKTIKQIVGEIRDCYALGIKNYRFMDLDLTADKERVISLCREIRRQNLSISWCCDARLTDMEERLVEELSLSGCKLLMFGIESLSERTHKTMSKGIKIGEINSTLKMVKRNDIQTLGYFRFGYIDENKEDIEQTIRNAKRLQLDFVSCEIFVPYPKTKFYEFAKGSIRRYSSDNIPLAYEGNLSYKELVKYVARFNRGFYLRPLYILGHLAFILNPRMIISGIRIFLKRF
jgi:anaerobic magnesium-protoporphyrin IX monomethyl ester cyclase